MNSGVCKHKFCELTLGEAWHPPHKAPSWLIVLSSAEYSMHAQMLPLSLNQPGVWSVECRIGSSKTGEPQATGVGEGNLLLLQGTGYCLLLAGYWLLGSGVLVMDCCQPSRPMSDFPASRLCSFIVCRGMMKHRSASSYIS